MHYLKDILKYKVLNLPSINLKLFRRSVHNRLKHKYSPVNKNNFIHTYNKNTTIRYFTKYQFQNNCLEYMHV